MLRNLKTLLESTFEYPLLQCSVIDKPVDPDIITGLAISIIIIFKRRGIEPLCYTLNLSGLQIVPMSFLPFASCLTHTLTLFAEHVKVA